MARYKNRDGERDIVADYKPKRTAPIKRSQPYEVNYFRRKHQLTQEQANAIIDKYANDRDAANKAAESLKQEPAR
jgi:hypothetical protein